MKKLLLALCLSPTVAAAGTFDIAYTSLERVIVMSVMTESGRHYLQGGPDDTCSYAFLQEPRISAAEGRLSIRFLFAGRAGKQVAGNCVGPGDNFDVVVSGVPRYASGEIFLDEATFTADNKLFDVFSQLIERQLEPLLRVPLEASLQQHLAMLSSAGAGRVEMNALDVTSIALGATSLTLVADYRIVVAP